MPKPAGLTRESVGENRGKCRFCYWRPVTNNIYRWRIYNPRPGSPGRSERSFSQEKPDPPSREPALSSLLPRTLSTISWLLEYLRFFPFYPSIKSNVYSESRFFSPEREEQRGWERQGDKSFTFDYPISISFNLELFTFKANYSGKKILTLELPLSEYWRKKVAPSPPTRRTSRLDFSMYTAGRKESDKKLRTGK